MTLSEIEFPKYSHSGLFDILKDRVEYSFKPRTLRTELIRLASAIAGGYARSGLEILRRAGRKAETRGKDHVTIEELKEAARESRKFRKPPLLLRLNEHERIIYEVP